MCRCGCLAGNGAQPGEAREGVARVGEAMVSRPKLREVKFEGGRKAGEPWGKQRK